MPRGGASHDISILPPTYSDDVGLTLLSEEGGGVAFRKVTRTMLPTSAPPGASSAESFDPEVRTTYTLPSYHLGVGRERHREGRATAGLVKNVDTRFEDQAFSGPKIRYINDINYLDNEGMEAFTGGVPDGWTEVSSPTTTQETTIVDSGISSAKVVSAGAGDLIRYTLAHGEFLQCRITLTARVFVPTGDAAAIVRIKNSIGDQDGTSVGTNAWETVTATLDVAAVALSQLTVDLIPTNGDTTYFDNVSLKIEYLVGPPGPFVELDISGTATLFHFSGRTTWQLDTADTDDNGLPRWIATELASHNITDVRLMNDRMWRAEGASGLWTHSTDGATWSDNSLSGADRFADQLAVTQSIFGYDVLWKTTAPNSLGSSTAPTSGGWAYYTIGNSDADILDVVVSDNLLYVVKEDGVWMIGPSGNPKNITASWAFMKQSGRSAGGTDWLGDAFIPAGAHGLWRFNPRTRRPAHPGDATPSYDEYNGPVTKVIADDSWLYAHVQKRDDSSPTITTIMAGRPTSDIHWKWSQVAEIDAGMVRHGWITGTQFAGTKMFWSSQETEASITQANEQQSSGTQTNSDNSGKREWSNVANIASSNDAYATWPDEADLVTAGDSPGTTANTDITDQIAWADHANAKASDDAYATSALVEQTTGDTPPSANSGASGWTTPEEAYTSDDTYSHYDDLNGFGSNSSIIEYDGFGFNLPTDAVITSIKISSEGNTSDATASFLLWGLIKGGTRQSHQAQDNPNSATDIVTSADEAIGTWFDSGTLSVAEAEASDFGIWLRFSNQTQGSPANSDFSVDLLTMDITYHLPKTDGLRATNYGITLPADAVIVGIQVDVERKVSAGTDVSDDLVQLVVGGSLSGDDKGTATAWSTSEGEVTYGGAADLWGLTPSRADIIASDFGVEIRATKGSSTTDRTLSVDHIKITITYYSNETSDFIDAQNFGFAIPTGSTINGIIVDIERKSSGGSAKDATLQLLNASGTPAGDDKALTLNAWPTSDASQSYGGRSDNWAISPTVSMVNDADFGLRFSITSDIDETASIDHISMTVYYTAAAGSELNNRLGWIALPQTENPRYDSDYEFESGGTLRTGKLKRFPGWQTAWQEVTVKTSDGSGETLGSNGRQFTAKYNIFDGNGFVELGGSGNGVFSTSPSQTKYFKTGTVPSVVSEDVEIELTFEHTEDDETPILEEISVSGTVRPRIIDVFEFSVVIADDLENSTLRGADILTALRAMLDPDQWSTTLYDRDGVAHQVIPYPNGYSEEDVKHYPDLDGRPTMVRVVRMQCFKVPNSDSWSS